MKTIIAMTISMLIVVLVTSVGAAPVTVEQVREMITGWRVLSDTPLETPLSKQIASIEPIHDTHSVLLYYAVHLEPEGFILTAPDDDIEPLIAFSAEGMYERDDRNPLTLLIENDMRNRLLGIASAQRRTGLPPTAPSAEQAKWERLSNAAHDSPAPLGNGLSSIDDIRVPPLMQTHWSQSTIGSPRVACYNYYTPPYGAGDTGNYVCGCTQTAWAQIMRYYRWPQASIGVITNTIRVDGVQESRTTLGNAYDWDQMPNQPDNSTTETQRQAIGAITHDIGVVNGASYTSGGTSAGMYITLLKTRFGYSNAKYTSPGYTSLSNCLLHAISANLDAGLVVQISLARTGGGHAVVGDGYGYNADALYHHLNLGWGGSSDAWYQLPDVDTGPYYYDTLSSVTYNVYTNGTGEIISGRVLDPSGNPLSGAVVTLKGNGLTNTMASNVRGIYAFQTLPSGESFILSATYESLYFTNCPVSTGTSPSYGAPGNRWGMNLTGTPVDYWTWANAITNGLTNYNDCAMDDGYPNLLKYAAGSSPTNSDGLAHIECERSNNWFVLRFNRHAAATDVVLTVEASFSLTNGTFWYGMATNTGGSWGGATNVQENATGSPVITTVHDLVPINTATSRFMRLRVEHP